MPNTKLIPTIHARAQFERYSDDELRLIAGFTRLATETLKRHADRIEAQAGQARRERDSTGIAE